MTNSQKIAIIFFSLFLFFPTIGIKAENYNCECYDGDDTCTPISVADDESACEAECVTDYIRHVWKPSFGACDTFVEEDIVVNERDDTSDSTSTVHLELTPGTASTTFEKPILGVNIPTISFSEAKNEDGVLKINWLGEYISGLYLFLLSIGGIIAVLLIMVGGVQYITSRGGSEVGEAKKRIINAVTGVVLLFSVFIILYVVNPKLTSFDGLEIQTVDPLLAMMTEEPNDAEGVITNFSVLKGTYTCPKSGESSVVRSIAESLQSEVAYRFGGGHSGYPKTKGDPYDDNREAYCEDGRQCRTFCPDNAVCLDCSGFVNLIRYCAGLSQSPYSAGHSDGLIITNCTNTSVTTSSGTKELTPGDRIFWRGSDDGPENEGQGHAFIYIGNGEIAENSISSRKVGQSVKIRPFSSFCSSAKKGTHKFRVDFTK